MSPPPLKKALSFAADKTSQTTPNSPTYLSRSSDVFFSGGGRNLVLLEDVGASFSAGGGSSAPDVDEGDEDEPAWESERDIKPNCCVFSIFGSKVQIEQKVQQHRMLQLFSPLCCRRRRCRPLCSSLCPPACRCSPSCLSQGASLRCVHL